MKKIKKVKLIGTNFSLRRENDGEGDSGPLLISYRLPKTKKEWRENSLIKQGKNGEIHLDCHIQCGSFYARTYNPQDYWMTTRVVEILFVNTKRTEVKFKTQNSIYILKSF